MGFISIILRSLIVFTVQFFATLVGGSGTGGNDAGRGDPEGPAERSRTADGGSTEDPRRDGAGAAGADPRAGADRGEVRAGEGVPAAAAFRGPGGAGCLRGDPRIPDEEG